MEREGSLSLTVDGRIVRFGKTLESILGFTSAEVAGKDFSSLFPPGAEGHKASSLIKRARETNAATDATVGMLKRDGSTVEMFVSVYPMRARNGDLNSFFLTVNTQRGAAVPAILTEEFQRMFRFSNDAVSVTDTDGLLIDVNQAWLDIYGYEEGEVLGRNPRFLKSSHSTKELYERMWSDILDPAKGYWRGEIINLRKDGGEVPVLLSINAIKDSGGEIKNFLGIAFNMSRQKELERVRRVYIDSIMHDIKGPLTTIMANAERMLLKSDTELALPVKKRLEVILSSSQRINGMARDMLDYSRAEAGRAHLRRERVPFGRVLKEATLPFEHAGKRLFINGTPFAEHGVPEVSIYADPDKLQRIIYNLLSNAFKYAHKDVFIIYTLTEAGLGLSVLDDGRGISQEEAGRIFDPYYQTAEGVMTGGAGLGLSIVKSFVEAHGGEVWVETGEGRGFKIGFNMPTPPNPPNPPNPPPG